MSGYLEYMGRTICSAGTELHFVVRMTWKGVRKKGSGTGKCVHINSSMKFHLVVWATKYEEIDCVKCS